MADNALFKLARQPQVKQRGTILPIAEYDDGSYGMAWPEMVHAPAMAFQRAVDSGMPLSTTDPDAAEAAYRDMAEVALGTMLGGSVASMGSGAARGAIGSVGGKLTQGAADLPMDLASRMARAREMEFNTGNVLYHGTRAGEFPEFSPSQSGTLGPGTYLTNSAADAGDFARFASGDSGPAVMPLMARGPMADMAEYRALLDESLPYRDAQREAIRILQDAGYSGLRSGNEVSVFDPRNIRSTNAAFDPARSDSANLLAANAKPGAALPLAAQDATPQGIRAYHGMVGELEGGKFDPSRSFASAHRIPRPYFADNVDEASGYAMDRQRTLSGDEAQARSLEEGGAVIPVDIMSKNPFAAYIWDKYPDDVYEKLVGDRSGLYHWESGNYRGPRSGHDILNDLRWKFKEQGMDERQAWEETLKTLDDAGYDSIKKTVPADYADAREYTQYIPVKPGTVYSATTGKLLYNSPPTGAALPLAADGEQQDIEPALMAYLKQIGLY